MLDSLTVTMVAVSLNVQLTQIQAKKFIELLTLIIKDSDRIDQKRLQEGCHTKSQYIKLLAYNLIPHLMLI